MAKAKVQDYENDFDKKAKKMKYNNTMDPSRRDVGSSTKVRAEKVQMINTATGKSFGSRTIIQKSTEGEQKSFLASLLDIVNEGAADITVLPDKLIAEIKKNISAGAADLQQEWKNALELVHKAYQVANTRMPSPDQKGAWRQYEDLIRIAVRELSKCRGINSNWRSTDISIREAHEAAEKENHIGSKRFFIHIPAGGEHDGHAEVDAKKMDDIIDTISNKLRRHGAKARVEERGDQHAVLSVWVHGVKRDEITIKEVS